MADFKWEGVKVSQRVIDAAMKALRTGGEAILTEAIQEAPVDTGTLRRSGTVTVGGMPNSAAVYAAAKAGASQQDAGQGQLSDESVVYVSFNTPYARRQHEETGYIHPRGGKAKYLEDPYKRNVDKVKRLVAATIRVELKKGLK